MDYWRFIQRRLHPESALHYPNNQVRKILKSYINGTMENTEKDKQLFFEQGFLLTAIGGYLDEFGGELGIPRKKGEIAKGSVVFTLSEPATSTLKIPRGTLIKSYLTQYEYITTRDAYIEREEDTVTVPVEAITYGAKFNAVVDELTIIDTKYLSENLTVTNKISIVGGEDGETDAHYRQRLFNSISTQLTINYLKKQGIIIYSKKKYNNNIRLKLSSLNPYLNNEYAAIPPNEELLIFLNEDVIHDKILQVYIKGWK